MISATESNSAEMAAPSAFSYAQAAKGQGTVPPASSTNPSSSTESSQEVSSTIKFTASIDTPSESLESVRRPDSRSTVAEKRDADSTVGSDADARSESVQEKRSEPRRDDESGRLDRPWRRNDKGTRSSSTTTRSADDQESRKQRKGKKARASDKNSSDQTSTTEKESVPEEEAPKIELSEAPIPSVNIWHQRKEAAQLAHGKSSNSQQDTPVSGLAAQGEDGKKTAEDSDASASVTKDTSSVNGAKPQRKAGDATRPERNGSRGSRVTDRESRGDGKPPSVADAAAWPTPEIAILEEKKKTTDKVDRPDKEAQDDASQAKPRQKEKWVTYDYVPTVNFETQIPQLRSSKPRGGARGTNGARAATGGQSTDKPSSQTASNKSSEPRDRPREASNGATRTTSLPPTGKRAPLDAAHAKEQRKPSGHSNVEKPKDTAANAPAEQNHAPRDRPEGRGDRGRGGYRGRGGHHPVNAHAQHQGGPGFTAPGPIPSRAQGPYSPPPRQGAHGQVFMPPPQRGGRGRSGTNANYHRMSLPNGAASRLAPVQTQFGTYEYPMGPMSAIPFQPQPYWDNVVLSLLKGQIEYYFSIENLCKDVFLRKRMDSQGFVHLHFIAAFKRIQDLSVDMGMIRAVCEASNEIDFVVGEDDIERVRRRSGWESFVLPMEDRDTFAQNNGPVHLTNKSRGYHFGHQFNGSPYAMSSPPTFTPQMESYQVVSPDPTAGHLTNGLSNGHSTHAATSQLSAEVPDFSPSRSFSLDEQAGKLKANGHENVNKAEAANGHGPEAPAVAQTNGVHSQS